MLAAFGCGLLLATLVIILIATFLRRAGGTHHTLQHRLNDAKKLPVEERQIALAHLLRDLTEDGNLPNWQDRAQKQHAFDPDVADMIGPSLYYPERPGDVSKLEAELDRVVACAAALR